MYLQKFSYNDLRLIDFRLYRSSIQRPSILGDHTCLAHRQTVTWYRSQCTFCSCVDTIPGFCGTHSMTNLPFFMCFRGFPVFCFRLGSHPGQQKLYSTDHVAKLHLQVGNRWWFQPVWLPLSSHAWLYLSCYFSLSAVLRCWFSLILVFIEGNYYISATYM